MNKKDKKLQKHLVDEMMKVYETNPNVMIYMQSLMENYEKLEKENNQLKEQLENKIDLYEDTISYQLGFDKGKEYLQQRIDKAIECIKTTIKIIKEQPSSCELNDIWTLEHLNSFLEILGDKEQWKE